MSHRRAAAAVFAGISALTALAPAGCARTDTLIGAFNGGALDTSSGDPFHPPATRRREMVTIAIRAELEDAYFGQGGDGAYVADWLRAAADNVYSFQGSVVDFMCARGADVGGLCAPNAASTTTIASRLRVRALCAEKLAFEPHEDVCAPPASPGAPPSIERFADFVRFHTAIERAARAVAALRIERLVDDVDVHEGAKVAFTQAAAYMKDRTWHRSRERRTTALVVKGGASTGIYSAGVVWVALNLITRCMEDEECRKLQKDFRFELVSGTSTGALISTAVDLFNTGDDGASRRARMRDMARWFTCSSVSSLYCVRSRPILDLLRDQTALLEFDGLTRLLRENVSCGSMTNGSELLLNTVDFRTGRLYSLSDQDRSTLRTPWDVVQGALASAVLPVIARPVEHFPVDYDAREPLTYLDGGIRSELPLMPTARRGAERVLVVSSSSSVLGESPRLPNALSIAARYIDISTGGITETELAHAQRYVESVRLAEIDACRDAVARDPSICPASSGCNVDALCGGDWGRACAGPGGASALAPGETVTPTTDERIAALWDMRAFFRDEARVEGLHGYDFDPIAQRALFQAGLDAARVRCMEIAGLLGIPVSRRRAEGESCARSPRSLRCRVVDWCSPVLPPKGELCAGVSESGLAKACEDATAVPTREELRTCR